MATETMSHGKPAVEPVSIGINAEAREKIVEKLNLLLSDEHVLYVKTRNYHWNVVGARFHPLHVFFEEQYNELAGSIDEIAERARSLGGRAWGTLAEFIRGARLKEAPGEVPGDDSMIANLLADHETIVRELRSDIDQVDQEYHDAGTADFLTGLLEQHEKMAWMLRAHLEKAAK